jgi:hypothetical protein
LEQRGREQLERKLDGFTTLYSSNLLEAELRAALHRENVDPAAMGTLDWLSWVLPDRALGPELERVLAAGTLRGADLWHVACCLFLVGRAGPATFVTADERQAAVAGAAGLEILS